MTPERLAREVFDEATRLKATGAEVFVRREVRSSASVHDLERESLQVQDVGTLGVRIFLGRRWALSHTTDLSPGAGRRAVRDAFALASLMPEDPHMRLAEGTEEAGVLELVDPALAGLTEEQRFEEALEIERGAYGEDPRVRTSRYVCFTDSRRETFLANTRGLELGYEDASVHLSAMFGAREGDAGQQLFGSESSRRLDGVSAPRLGKSVARRLGFTLGGSALPTGTRDVVLDPSQAPYLVAQLAEALNGESVHLGRSYLRDRVGERVASEGFHLRDAPFLAEESGSAPWDDEGVPCRDKTMVEAGILKGYLFDIVSASKAGTVSTGNGFRASVGSPARATPTQLVLGAGEESIESLVAGVEEGLYVAGFMGRGIDPVSGRLSAAALGARIRSGRIAEPVTGVTISGHLDDFLSSIDGFADVPVRQRGITAPGFRVRNVTVAGS